jgi:[ribosomal protein S5]-alanine N-acetyltransferase
VANLKRNFAMSPVIETDRLTLRRFETADCVRAVPLIGDWDVVKNLSHPPYPYTDAHFHAWLSGQEEGFAAQTQMPFAITLPGVGVIGTTGVHERGHERGENWFELGYWLGKPYWGQGFATEAGHAVLGWFGALRPDARVKASHFEDNPASGKVLRKLGFSYTGQTLLIDSVSRGETVTSLAMTLQPMEERP